MRSVSAKIVDGKVVNRAKLPEELACTLDEAAVAGISRGIEDHRAGRVVPAAKLLAFLRRP